MEKIKDAIQQMEKAGHKFNTPFLQLGIKQEGGGVRSTGLHIVKAIEEPKVVMGSDPMSGKERKEFSFRLVEDGTEKKYNVPLFNKEGEPHYLLQRLADIPVGEKFGLEMKSKGMKSYIEVVYPIESSEGDDIPTIEEDEINTDGIKEDGSLDS